ncbi:MAG: nucleoside-diphosphate-sugar epimerase [Paracoccaceae bacterium]|jgi:nucleoside-diphosphate-sugar epimerase
MTKNPENDFGAAPIILPGGAGLVGQNLVPRLKAAGFSHLVVIDKHVKNLEILHQLHPDIMVIEADLAESGPWQQAFAGARGVVMLQAQIGGIFENAFLRNNISSTELILEAIRLYQVPQLIHVSSSVVNSVADDFYTRSKIVQEEIVLQSEIAATILRPTLMFGWFDRKHLGWLSRFMRKMPVFPIPGSGRYMRQPLFVGDFSNIILSCLQRGGPIGTFNISGQERIDYIDIIRAMRHSLKIRRLILIIPYWLFYGTLAIWARFDRNPPFTTHQLAALVAPDDFEVIDWPSIFGVKATPLPDAFNETFRHPIYSKIELEF